MLEIDLEKSMVVMGGRKDELNFLESESKSESLFRIPISVKLRHVIEVTFFDYQTAQPLDFGFRVVRDSEKCKAQRKR